MKFVYYWSPFISKVATIRSVINSAESLKKYSKNDFEPIILNVAGEWNFFKKSMNIHNIKIVDLTTSKILDGKFNYFLKLNENNLKNFEINSKKKVRQFKTFRHHNQLINILNTNV